MEQDKWLEHILICYGRVATFHHYKWLSIQAPEMY